jgi:hypothetical protein
VRKRTLFPGEKIGVMLIGPVSVRLVKYWLGLPEFVDHPMKTKPGYGNAFKITFEFAGR